jgi:hypothetical protein
LKSLAQDGKKVMLVSTDPASNLQDVFQTTLTNKPTTINGINNLMVANFDPITAAEEPSCAKETAVAQAVVVLPTPPFPVKNRYLVSPIFWGIIYASIYAPKDGTN